MYRFIGLSVDRNIDKSTYLIVEFTKLQTFFSVLSILYSQTHSTMKFFTLFLVSFCCTTLSLAQTEWKLKKEVDNLKVYYRESEHSTINEIKVRYIAEASLSNIVAVLKDVPGFTGWIYSCAEARVLEQKSNKETIYYSRLDFPFPMSDRDFIAKSKLWQDATTKEIFIKVIGDTDYLPAKKNIVRLPKLVVNWHIKPLTGKRVQIEYHILSDPGGSIPDWLVNLAIDKGPVNSMQAFKEMLDQAKYRTAQLAYIEEFSPHYFGKGR